MKFYSVRDLRTGTKNIWDNLTSGDDVVITNDDKPSALMIDIPEGSIDEVVQAVLQAKAMNAFNSMLRKAARASFLTDEEIEAVISDVRNTS